MVGKLSNVTYSESEKVYRADLDGRRVWCRDPEIGEELLDYNGTSVSATIRAGTKSDLYQLISLNPITV